MSEALLPKFLLAGILIACGILLSFASLHDAATMDELAHIPSGYSYVKFFDFRLNPEHPPLVKALAGLPLLSENLSFPLDHASWTKDVNGQWDAGAQFLYFSGNDADRIIRLARIGPIFLTLLLVIGVYAFSKKRMGAWWALLPAMLAAFSPTILAHGHYVTTDVGAALGILISIYFFVRFLEKHSGSSLLLAGVTFGIAQSLKFSAVLLIPYFIFLTAAWLFRVFAGEGVRWRQKFRITLAAFGKLMAIFAMGYVLIIYPLYFLFTLHYPIERQSQDTATILTSFADGPTPDEALCNPKRCLADLTIAMSGKPLLRPIAEYALGVLMVTQRAAGGNTNYFLGEVSNAGSKLYFPLVYLVKEPLPILILLAIAFLVGVKKVWRAFRGLSRPRWRSLMHRLKSYLETRMWEFSLLGFIIFYWIYSIQSPLNIGVRHLLPVIPLSYILASRTLKDWVQGSRLHAVTLFEFVRDWFVAHIISLPKRALIFGLFVWLIVGALFSYPYFLSYFNVFGGGTERGYRIVTDSNYDWGQDLLEFKEYIDTHPAIDRVAMDYFGGGNPKYYLGDKVVYWSSSKGDPREEGVHWLAVSVGFLQASIQPMSPGLARNPTDEYRWLQQIRPSLPGMGNVPEPDKRIGTSIFLYKL